MRVIAYYQQQTPTFYRRLGAIFAVLTNRGYTAVYQQAQDVRHMKVSTYDLVILADWSGRETLPEIPGQYLYDLSDADQYNNPYVRQILEQCSGVFVPSKGIQTALSSHLKTLIQPSVVPAELLTQLPVTSPRVPRLTLLRPFDWLSIREPLLKFVRQYDVQVLTDDPALSAELPPAKALFLADVSPIDYLAAARSSTLLLCPGVSPVADPAIQLDFGYVGAPALISPVYAEQLPAGGSVICRTERDWFTALSDLLTHDRQRGVLSAAAQQRSRRFTATRRADEWWTSTAKFCAVAG